MTVSWREREAHLHYLGSRSNTATVNDTSDTTKLGNGLFKGNAHSFLMNRVRCYSASKTLYFNVYLRSNIDLASRKGIGTEFLCKLLTCK